jgi:hypothetical protein
MLPRKKAHRVDEPRDADDARVGRDDEDRRGEDADVDLCRALQGAQVELLDHTKDGIAREPAVSLVHAQQRLVAAVGVLRHRQRAQGDHRQEGVDREDRDDDPLDRLGDGLLLVSGLLGHVRDRLYARVGDHPDGDRQEEVLPGRRDPQVHVVDQRVRREDQEEPDEHQQQLRQEVRDGQQDVHAGGLLHADDVQDRQQDDDGDAEEDVPGRMAQRVPEEPSDVVRHEVRRDGDRDRVVEHLRPGREERPELVERVAREARRPAGLGVHRCGLGVGRSRQVEDDAGDDEHHRGEAQREARHQPEGVVDRGPDVAVGRREEGVDAQDALEPVEAAFGHVEGDSL